MRWLDALILGLVQGLTEFLPISSDGHLAVVGKALKMSSAQPGEGDVTGLFFIVMLHVGTLAAILAHYRRVGWEGFRGFVLNDPNVPHLLTRKWVFLAGIYACLATLPAIPVGLFLKDHVEAAFNNLAWSGAGFLVTAFMIGMTMWVKGGETHLDTMKWWHALVIGVAQTLAILPGVSRSGMTICTALMLGFSRSWAVGFSLWMAVPAILGATVLELKDFDPSILKPGVVGPMLAGVLVAFVVGYLAIVWLVRVVRGGRMWYFSIYLIALSVAIFTWLATNGSVSNASATAGLGRPTLRSLEPGGNRSPVQSTLGALGRPLAPGPVSG